jgi:hypothetical protein
MRWYRFLPGVAVCVLVLASSSSAILIETGGNKIGGYLVRADEKKVTIRIQTPDGQESVEDYSPAKITILHQLDVKRLTALSKDNPQGYREYADELAKQQADPEARYMARRLYLIAASLDPHKLGVGSLLAMSTVADTPAEARKYRALAYLLDAKADTKLLVADETKQDKTIKVPADSLKDFTKAMQYYRAGKLNLASDTASRQGMDKVFSLAPGNMSQKSFRQMCTEGFCPTCKSKGKVRCTVCNGKGVVRGMFGNVEFCATCSGKKVMTCETCGGRGINQDLSEDTLRVILRAELWATEQMLGGADGGAKKKADDSKGWSSVLQRRQQKPVLPLSLETSTEFDPRKCHYRNGTWVVPSE